MTELAGIHHITAIAGDPQQNLDFYAGFLGLRLVKLTVNFDAPDTYHFYFGDELGRPGTLLTFFPWPGARRGRKGTGQASIVAYAIPPAAIHYWTARLGEAGIHYEGPIDRAGHTVLSFFDPDDLQLELVALAEANERAPWAGGPVPEEHAVRGLYGVTLIEESLEPTDALLAGALGFRRLGQGANHRHRYGTAGSGPAANYVDVLALPGMVRAQMGVGAIHHIAWRTPDRATQDAWRRHLLEQGLQVTPVLDRKYFSSIYFREPGGVLFEIATDGPGFAVDEPADALGASLQLPGFLEAQRAAIERTLSPLRLPAGTEHVLRK